MDIIRVVGTDDAPGQQLLASAQTAIKEPSPARSCRICFDDGDDLIAPCRCSGTSKWIHRSCLNHWRVSGTNPRALTHCCECNFQYELELHRKYSEHAEERRNQFLRAILKQSVYVYFGVQLCIVLLGMLVKLCDPDDVLVKFLPFERIAKVYGYFPSLQHYALTYYVAGLIVFMVLFGIFMLFLMCGFRPPREECHVCADGAELCCMSCCNAMMCQDCAFFGCEACFQGLFGLATGPEMLLVVAGVLLVAILIVGVFAAIVTVVIVIQRACQQYMRMYEMGVLAEEYMVKDLSLTAEEKAVRQQTMESDQERERMQTEINQQVERDLAMLFGSSHGRTPPRSSYGSTDNLSSRV